MSVVVAYPGRDGAHTAAACEQLFPSAELVSLPSFGAAAQAAAVCDVDFAVLPIENTLVGPIFETHDLLYDSPLSITGETVLAIRHCLVGVADVPLEEVRVIRSHPAALDQCRRLLGAMPWASAVAAATTADAAAEVAADGDPSTVAIASERAARLHGLTVLVGNVGDHPNAYTRFVALGTYTRLDVTTDRWRTAFSFVTDHQPGALHRAIEPFASAGIDLLQLVSRPIPQTPWRYRFDAVFEGHPLDAAVKEPLAEMRRRTRRLRVFGSYPAEGQ